MPLDTELWHTKETSDAFEKHFGIWKEILAVCIFGDEYSNHMYVPVDFVERAHARIGEVYAKDPRGMEKLFLAFYDEKTAIMREVPKINPPDIAGLSDAELARLYRANRMYAHHIVKYDQFTWLTEDYWLPIMDEILAKRGLTKGSDQYNEALFALIKPHEISTTLEEKREAIRCALAVLDKKMTVDVAAKKLAASYGWMPVLAYGDPWDEIPYKKEQYELSFFEREVLEAKLADLEAYSEKRDSDIAKIVEKYGLTEQELQMFVDFGLAIDSRNEAEYMASICGFYVLPIYREMARRFDITVDELRKMYEADILKCLEDGANAKEVLAAKGEFLVWFLDGESKQRVDFSSDDGKSVFAHAESFYAGASGGELRRGITANKGKVQGKVCRVPTPEDNAKVEAGDILIAYSTTVNDLPGMKKAAAFVTESGGLTCHAAVVAREFGVPCIVSLHGAMDAFKDGQMVEVDADGGIVRRL